MESNEPDFALLGPDCVLDAIESLGFVIDARIFALNSYENRVYQIGLEDAPPLIAKFYRPKRWTQQQILEEHDFCLALAEHELPVVAPMRLNQTGEDKTLHGVGSLFEHRHFRFALFPQRGGHPPELDNLDHLYQIGLQLGRIHSLGRHHQFTHRLRLSINGWGRQSQQFLLENNFIPASLTRAYESLSNDLLQLCEQFSDTLQATRFFRIHGDCHPGNILFRDGKATFVDFDDAVNGPAIQDIWMLLSGPRENRIIQLCEILEAYNEFCDFDHKELVLIELLRTLRIMHYAAWLAKRWSDPSFPVNFPWFNTERYWSEHILELREQYAMLQEEPLSLPAR